MVPVKLTDQVPCLVTEGELFGVTGEHDLGDVDAEKLALLGLAQTVEQDVVYGAFSAADDRLTTIFVQELRLVLHIDLLFQLQIVLAKDQDLAFKRNVDISGATNG